MNKNVRRKIALVLLWGAVLNTALPLLPPLAWAAGERTFDSQGPNGPDGLTFLGSGFFGGNGANEGPVSIIEPAPFSITSSVQPGIYARTRGGNGGLGGDGFTLPALPPVSPNVSVSGGWGGAGGSGGDVTVNVSGTGTITTNGGFSGIHILSLGGQGGQGGLALGVPLTLFGRSGDGGAGGAGGDITVTDNKANITVNGGVQPDQFRAGILAQSAGSVGGIAGDAIGSVANQVGNTGASGGGGNISITNNGEITAILGTRSHGIFAESTGGVPNTAGGVGFGLVSFGVSPAGSGNGGTVTLNNHGAITTSGLESRAISLRSAGGGGGDGATAIGLVAIGGTGASAGDGGTVALNSNTGNITTRGLSSEGIYAQSVGGGGGSGGGAVGVQGFVGFALGGSGAGGGDGGAVTVKSGLNNSGAILPTANSISTSGHHSTGIFAQSLGGGGGNGGFAVAGSVGIGELGSVSVGIGGSGNTGGAANKVEVTSASNITTGATVNVNDPHLGFASPGIQAQSLGGGGGSGGFSVAAALSDGVSAAVAIGGSGNAGGAGGEVVVNQKGSNRTLETFGGQSDGILAQSIGGGGGSGGFSVAASGGKYGAVSVGVGGTGAAGGTGAHVGISNESTIKTHGEHSNGILAQSTGGGGGSGGFAVSIAVGGTEAIGDVSVAVGGSGGPGSAAGRVDVANFPGASIETFGKNSIGIAAQSTGGGGGNAGFAGVGVLNMKQGGNFNIGAAVGGRGGVGGSGGLVDVTSAGAVTTHGDDSYGVLAQSTGGGGGVGGMAVSTIFGLAGNDGSLKGGSLNVTVAVGGNGGDGNSGGVVSVVQSQGSITTEGDRSHAIAALSTGGGGGMAGGAVAGIVVANTDTPSKKLSIPVSIGGTGGSGNLGGNVTVNNSGMLTTQGEGAYGILAQSIGGGGGNGGGANSFSFFFGSKCHLPLGIGCRIGSSESPVFLWERPDPNVVKPGYTLAVAVGGAGGNGNHGGAVAVTNSGSITTDKKNSTGILAQSIGQGGGNGGNGAMGLGDLVPDLANFALTPTVLPFSNAGTLSTFTAAVGGHGGGSGNGDEVQVMNYGSVTTNGVDAHAIQAQSIGAGGGSGGSGNVGITGTLALGGWAGASGSGGAVTVCNISGSETHAGCTNPTSVTTPTITTKQNGAIGIFAQSVGGGGGVVGTMASLAVPPTTPGTLENNSAPDPSTRDTINVRGSGGRCSGLICLGGAGTSPTAGGSQGDGGRIDIVNDGNITTGQSTTSSGVTTITGLGSHGILAQSIGGGGGLGGAIAPLVDPIPGFLRAVAVGGAGGAAGDGGAVTITNQGSITTHGYGAKGVWAQSVGGGGGSGGASAGLISIGGTGGANGLGGAVTINNNSGSITTHGNDSTAILATSAGGGGGDLLLTDPASSGGGAGGSVGLLVAIGGAPGTSGDGGTVTVNNNGGTITTRGAQSHGISALSVGGGGGNAGGSIGATLLPISVSVGADGGAGGAGGNVTVTNAGSITTHGESANGIVAQSIGGGGGNGGLAVSASLIGLVNVSVGGAGGQGGQGGNVTVTNGRPIGGNATITTNGSGSTGIFAQSVGGGGGTGGLSVTAAIPIALSTFAVGGNGGAASGGGNVEVRNNHPININGDYSTGIVAQSVGGGGGTGALGNVAVGVPWSFGGQNGVTGHGGNVTVVNNSNGPANRGGFINITGNNSVGIFAQSVGGGGGRVTVEGGALQLQLLSQNHGDGGRVEVTNFGTINLGTGSNNVAFLGQTVAGGGGTVTCGNPCNSFMGSAGGVGNTQPVTLSQTGHLVAAGADSVALLAQSDAMGVRGDITVDILNQDITTPSVIMGGSGTGAGVKMLGGTNNRLNNHGIITNILGVDGKAIIGDKGNNTINNLGQVIGSVELGIGSGAFNNSAAASFVPGPTVNLGGGALTTHGTLSLGDLGRTQTTALTGSFAQTGTGKWLVDYDNSGTSAVADRVSATGSGNLAGQVTLNLINTGLIKPGSGQVPLLSANGGVTNSGATLNAPRSAIARFELLYPTANEAAIGYNISFSNLAGGGLNGNQTAIGNYINNVQLAGGSASFAPIVTTLLGLPDGQALAAVYNQLSPEVHLEKQFAAWFSNQQFGDAMLSCRARDGAYRFVTENECGWMTMGGSAIHQDKTSANFGFERSAFKLAGGIQKAINDTWHWGIGAGYESSWLNVKDLSSSRGHEFQLGAVVKARFGSSTLSYLFDVGHGWNETTRRVNLLLPGLSAKSDPELTFVTNRVRAAHAFEQGSWYWKPMIDLGASFIRSHSFNERGAAGANLAVRTQDQTYLTLSPALEVGGEIGQSGSMLFRPYAKVGLTHLFTSNTPSVQASVRGAPGVAPFTVSGKNDKNYGDVSVGVDVLNVKGVDLRVGYTGQFSERTNSHGGTIKFGIKF